MRRTSTTRDVRAGCFTCHGDTAQWFGGNAQGVAARHHDATGHPTWAEVHMGVYYGAPPGAAPDREPGMER